MNDPANERRRTTVFYRGQVQGVGFRYTAQRLARGRPVAGFVRNLPHGEVELVVEGTRESIDAYLGSVAAELGHYITEIRPSTEPARGDFAGFEIRR